MPTYQYVCTACDEPLEAVQAFSDAALTECPSCGGRLRKVFSSVGIVFKGSGFYRNDSREPVKAGAGADGAGKDATDSKDSKDSKDTAGTKSEPTGSDASSTAAKAAGKAPSKPSGETSSRKASVPAAAR